jgi:hypothetical protein
VEVPLVGTTPDRSADVRRARLVEGLSHASSFNPARHIARKYRAKKNDGNTLTAEEEEEVARVSTDAVFEFACRFVVMKSLRGRVDEICTECSQSVQLVSVHAKGPRDRPFLAGVP